MEAVIPIADLQPIYSVAEVERASEDGAARRNGGPKSWYERMRELGGSRYIIKPSTTAAVDDDAPPPADHPDLPLHADQLVAKPKVVRHARLVVCQHARDEVGPTPAAADPQQPALAV